MKDPTAEDYEVENPLQWTEYMMKIKTTFHHSQDSSILIAQLYQTYFAKRTLSMNPFVSIGKILPIDSPIFSLVREGDVEGLQALISQGQATLRDRDSFGTPLIHVSTLSIA